MFLESIISCALPLLKDIRLHDSLTFQHIPLYYKGTNNLFFQWGICNSPRRPDRNGYRSLHGIKNRKSLHPRQAFWALPRIYQGKIEELKGVMVRKEAAELIGTVTGSKTLINMAKRRKKGEEMELCNSLKRLVEEHEKIGESRGLEKGVTKGRILTYHDVGWEEARIAEKLKISRKEVRKVLKKAGESK